MFIHRVVSEDLQESMVKRSTPHDSMRPFWIHLKLLAEFGIPPQPRLGGWCASFIIVILDIFIFWRYENLSITFYLNSLLWILIFSPTILHPVTKPSLHSHGTEMAMDRISSLVCGSCAARIFPELDWTRDGRQRHPKKHRGNHVFLVPDF